MADPGTNDVSAQLRTRFLFALLGVAALAVLAIWSGSFSRSRSIHSSRPIISSSVVATVPQPVPAAVTPARGPLPRPEREYRWASAAFLPEPVPQRVVVRVTPLYTAETIGLQVRVRF
ncbi:hypothetical protein HQ590_13020 [bacterium]|nr:hypothetical protein [bacterium]